MKLTNFFSNLWIITNLENNNIDAEFFLSYISKVKIQHNINKIINFDKEFKFWNSNISNIFENTISTQMILDNQKKCLNLYKKISILILNSLLNNNQILLVSCSKNECLIGFILYFICKKGNIELDKAFNTLNSKLDCLDKFILNTNIKKILISECYPK